jgi:cytochrome P450
VRAVVNETLRLFPPVPLNVRESRDHSVALPPSDDTYNASSIPRRFYMPRNTNIVYLPLLTQRNPSLWGPDADSFNPERWLDPVRIAEFVKNPAKYAPFSAGPRIVCPKHSFWPLNTNARHSSVWAKTLPLMRLRIC